MPIKNTLTSVLLSLFLSLASQQTSEAGYVFSFNTFGTDQAFTVVEGSSIDVPIYLVQTDGENRLSTIGLYSSGASVTIGYDSGAIGNSFASQPTLAGHWTDLLSNRAEILVDQVVLEGLIDDPAFPVFATSNSILLGTIEFQSGVSGNLTSLELSLDNVTPMANLFVDANEVGPISFRKGTISAVPEPSSFLLVAAPIAMGMYYRVKTKRKRQ
jgi:hypothetical protein